MNKKQMLILPLLLSLGLSLSAQEAVPDIERVLEQLTLEEKIALIHAQSKFSSPGVGRLGIPELWCTDGPHGIRPDVLWDEWEQAGCTNDSCTAFPALTCLAATWDPALSLRYGQAIGEEARYRRKSVLLGPGINICRTPLNGRSFEYMGEDPFLTSRMAVPYIEGVQQQAVAVCVKHYALNNNEHERYTTNVECDERTLREIYLPAFEAAVREAGAWTLMGGYNLYRNQHVCHHQYLMNEILKEEWRFDGAVISDWGGTQSTREAIFNGLDLEYGTWTDGLTMGRTNAYDDYYLAQPYLDMIRRGEVGTRELDDKVRRVLRLISRTAMSPGRGFGSINSPEHLRVAREVGAAGIVLLKNDIPALAPPSAASHKSAGAPLLPLDTARIRRLLVVGENAIKMMTVGGGSSSLKARHEILPLEGLRDRLARTGMEIRFARGYVGDPGGEYNGVTTGQDLRDERSAAELRAEAIRMAREADAVVYIGGLNKSWGQDSEGADRRHYGLPYGQDTLIAGLLDANPRLIVVNISGNAVAMPWADRVPAIVQGWYLGSEAGVALAQVLVGDVNPSGRLPISWYASLDQCAAHAPVVGRRGRREADPRRYPGIERKDSTTHLWDIYYDEGLYVGYRYLDRQRLRPLFPFGHGLSYTSFAMSGARLEPSAGDTVRVSVEITNTGSRAGAEVVQLYVQDVRSSVDRPEKELKAFGKVFLEAGETRTLTLSLPPRAFRFYDVKEQTWRAEPGRFVFHIGNSSRNILQKVVYDL